MASDPEYQRAYYLANREKRLADAKQYQRKRRAERKEYMRAYYAANPEKWELSRKEKDERNQKRRERYHSDPAVRARAIADATEYRKRRPHVRWARGLKRFELTLDKYDAMLSEQGGGCAICGGGPGDARSPRYHVDHCHTTGRVRGLLCSSCNLGLGKFRDRADFLERAIVYLRASVGTKAADK